MKKRWLILIVIVAALAAGVVYRTPLWAWGSGVYRAATGTSLPATGQAANTSVPAALVASGAIEARTIDVGSPVGGRLAVIGVAEGDQVAAGQLIAQTNTALDDAQLAQAQAGVTQAEAQLALLRAGARTTDLDVARAALKQAQAAAATSQTAWQDAQALVTAPGSLDVKIASAEAAVQAAQEQLKAVQATATAADLEEGLWARTVTKLLEGFDVTLPYPGRPTVHVDVGADKTGQAQLQWNEASQRQWQAHAQVGVVSASLETARETLADLRSQKADPQSMQAQANAAESAYQMAVAAVGTAQANLDVAQAGATDEQIRVAEALVEQAKGSVTALLVKRDQARIVAPQAGTITAVVQRQGEVVAMGSPIVQLADLSQVTLDVYVPEPELGRVHLGQAVQVAVDSFPGRVFDGAVTQIANEAEFTPKNVATRQERANTVFAIRITLPNSDSALKPGMPADATFCEAGAAAANCAGIQTAQGGSTGAADSAFSRAAAGIASLTGNQPAAAGPIQASGTVQGTETTIGAELGGRVVEVAVAEGTPVKAGQVLVRLDSSQWEAQRNTAESALAAANADLVRVSAPPQSARVAQAKAQVAQAAAALAAARSGLADAQKLRANPQDLNAQIDNARTQINAATAQIDVARANVKAAQVLQQSLQVGTGSDQDKTKRAMYDQQVAAADAMQGAAEIQQQGAQAALNQLLAMRGQPVALDAAVHKAEGQVTQGEAALATAQAVLAQVQAPAQPEAVALAQTKVAQAQTGVDLISQTITKLTVASPLTGTVTTQMIHTGEVAQPGIALMTLVDLSRVKLVIYVPAGRIGMVKLGQHAQVTVDAYPGRTFEGTVTHINDQGEFTPKNIQTQEERVKTVFGVEIALDNTDGVLKPGMPADAVLR
jgi:HlyD family secretion protein